MMSAGNARATIDNGRVQVNRAVGKKDKLLAEEFLDKNDSQIWDSFRSGNEAAFAYIYKKHVNPLFNYGIKFSDDREQVSDCIHDLFLYIRDRRERLGATTSVKYYLMRAFRRRLTESIDKRTKEKRHQRQAVDFQLEVEDCNVLDFIHQEAKEDLIYKLNKSLVNLTAKEREALFFFYYEGLSYKEIADLMDFLHVSSARRLIYSAVNNLRIAFQHSGYRENVPFRC